jgi:hypothetical protein
MSYSAPCGCTLVRISVWTVERIEAITVVCGVTVSHPSLRIFPYHLCETPLVMAVTNGRCGRECPGGGSSADAVHVAATSVVPRTSLAAGCLGQVVCMSLSET